MGACGLACGLGGQREKQMEIVVFWGDLMRTTQCVHACALTCVLRSVHACMCACMYACLCNVYYRTHACTVTQCLLP